MNITLCMPAGKPKGWYDATGTRYYHPQELDGASTVTTGQVMKKEENHILATNLRIYAKTADYPSVKAAMLRAADEIERLMIKIEKYAFHDRHCLKLLNQQTRCTCGYDRIYE